MFHLLARAIDGHLVFRSWPEARVLWDTIVDAMAPGLAALVILPDQLHLLHPLDERVRLAAVLSGYVRWRNHTRRAREVGFAKLPPARAVDDTRRVQNGIRFLHALPCRQKWVDDPLSWPFVTHRDACGLAWPAAVPRVRHVESFHRHVSAELGLSDDRTALPAPTLRTWMPRDVLHAVSALTRTPLSSMPRRSPARSLYLRAAVELCPDASSADVGSLVGVQGNTVLEAAKRKEPNVRLVSRVIGDPRFAPLHHGRLQAGLPHSIGTKRTPTSVSRNTT